MSTDTQRTRGAPANRRRSKGFATTEMRERRSDSTRGRHTLIGWDGIRFTLPPDWNLTAFSNDRPGGYLKVDSPGTMFAQVKWFDTRPADGPLLRLLSALPLVAALRPAPRENLPDLRAVLDRFLEKTA